MSAFFRQAEINLRQLFNDFQCHSHSDDVIGKNYIINPSFNINQRGFAGGAIGSGAFSVDRWRDASGASNADFVDGVMTVNSGRLLQVVERFNYSGGVVLSWEGTASLTIGILGSGDKFNNVTSPYPFNITSTDDWYFAVNSVGTCSKVKLEVGGTVTLFEYPDQASEFQKCLRYYYQSNKQFTSYLGDGTGNTALGIDLPTIMRAAPTLSYTVNTGTDVGGQVIDESGITIFGTVDGAAPSRRFTISLLKVDAEL